MAGKFPSVGELANFLDRTVQQSQQSTSMIGWHMLSEHMSQQRWWQQQQQQQQQQQKEWSIFLGSNINLGSVSAGYPKSGKLPKLPSPLCQTTQLQSCRVERWASGKAGGAFEKKHLNVFSLTVPLAKNDALEKTHYTLFFGGGGR